MKVARTLLIALVATVFGVMITGSFGQMASAVTKPPISISPSHIQTPDAKAATMWVNNRTGAKVWARVMVDNVVQRGKGIPARTLGRVPLSNIGRSDYDHHVRVWVTLKSGRTFEWKGFYRRPKPDIEDAATRVRGGSKVIELRVNSSVPVALVTNSVIHMDKGDRWIKCLYTDFDGSAFTMACDKKVGGDFQPDFVNMFILTKRDGTIETIVDKAPA